MESLVSALGRESCTFSPGVERVMNEVKRSVVDRLRVLMAFRESLHEVDFALVLPCAGAFAGSTSPGECHVPVLIMCIPQRCVVVLQNNLSEDTIPTLAIFLANEFALLVHTDVEACFCPFDSDSAAKGVSFHNKFCMNISVLGHGVDFLVGQDLHMLAAGAAVELIHADKSAAHTVRHPALLAHVLREIRRGLIGYLCVIAECQEVHQAVDNRKYVSQVS